MFCISTWCGFKQVEADSWRLFSKLGGNFLGYLHVDSKLPIFERIKDLQVQASNLMKHQTRFPRDILFWKQEQELLPEGFAYRESLEKEEEDCIQDLLGRDKKGGLAMMYNEDDSVASQVCTRFIFQAAFPSLIITTDEDEVPMEILFLEHLGVTQWVVFNHGWTSSASLSWNPISLRFLRRSNAEHVTIYGRWPSDWQDCNKRSLELRYGFALNVQHLVKLDRLETLTLNEVENVKALAVLPRLKSLTFTVQGTEKTFKGKELRDLLA